MRDRSNNPRPLQKGRLLSVEAIQTVQALERAQNFLNHVFDSKFWRELKLNMMVVLRDLLRHNECFLALKVFEDIRKEHCYRPHFSPYSDMIKLIASNGLFEQVEHLCLYLKKETNLQPEIEAFNALMTTLISFNLPKLAFECHCLMKEAGYELDSHPLEYSLMV